MGARALLFQRIRADERHGPRHCTARRDAPKSVTQLT